MRKLILQMQFSLDGFVSRPNGSLDWLVWDFSDNWTWDLELKNKWNRIFGSVDHILLSGNMAAEGYIDHWSALADDHMDDPQFEFAKKIKDSPKLIFSRHIKNVQWPNASLAKGDIVEEISRLKKRPGGDIIVFGGASFASALLRAGVMDELQLFINPVVLGEGISIFNEIGDLNLQLLESTGYDCGISILQYRADTRPSTYQKTKR